MKNMGTKKRGREIPGYHQSQPSQKNWVFATVDGFIQYIYALMKILKIATDVSCHALEKLLKPCNTHTPSEDINLL